MFDKLCETYPEFKYTTTSKPQSQVCYVEDRISCPAHFIVSSVLDYYLKNNDGVIFVALQQNYAHYYSISKRIGNSLDPHLKSELLTYIDFFNSLTDWVPEDLPLTEEATIFWNPLPPKVIKMKIEDNEGEALMNKLYDTIVKELEKKKGTCGIVIDNLTVFLSLGVSMKSIITFYSKLYDLITNSEKKPSLYFVVTKEIMTKEQNKLALIFEKNCNYLFRVYPNPSGYSQDVHGQLEITHKDALIQKEYTFKFKLHENKIDIFKYLSG